MVGVYILYSAKLDQFYTGLSTHPQRRLRQHRRGTSTWTRRATDWVQVYQIQVETLAQGRAVEKHIKQRGARRFLEEQLPNPAWSWAGPAWSGAGLNACPAGGGIASSNLVSRATTCFAENFVAMALPAKGERFVDKLRIVLFPAGGGG